MRTQRLGWAVVLGGVVLAGWAGSAGADAACRQQAKDEYLACKAECKEDYLAAKMGCRNVDPGCGIGCLAGRQACRDAVEAILATGQLPGGGTLDNCSDGTDGCRSRLEAEKAACGAPCTPGDTVCDACVDAAQVTAFVCRDTCRESWRANAVVAALKLSCRDTFKACIEACPPLP